MNLVRPFGDHADDGLVQVSFSLPVASSQSGRLLARAVATKMGLTHVEVVHETALTPECCYFVVYGRVDFGIDPSEVTVEELDYRVLSKDEVERAVEEQIGRPVRIIGASTGTDTHSVGIDAILNLKGYNGHAGLEAYRGFIVENLGSQVPNEELLRKAVEMNADAILVSQTVTQQHLHVQNLTALVDLLEAERMRERFLIVCGGARISPGLAKELGFDAGFSKGTYAEDVGSWLVTAMRTRRA